MPCNSVAWPRRKHTSRLHHVQPQVYDMQGAKSTKPQRLTEYASSLKTKTLSLA